MLSLQNQINDKIILYVSILLIKVVSSLKCSAAECIVPKKLLVKFVNKINSHKTVKVFDVVTSKNGKYQVNM